MGKKRESKEQSFFEGISNADPAQLEKIQEKVQAKLEKHEEKLEDLKNQALKLYEEHVEHEKSSLQLGRVLVKIRTMTGHGDFTKWWKKEKLTQARVSYCLRLAQGKIPPPDERKQSPRAKVLSSIGKKVAALYDAIAKETDKETLDGMIAKVVAEIKNLSQTVEVKTKPALKAKAARAGQ